MNEVWTQARYLTTEGDVLVFPNYEVSNLGRVRNKKTGRFLSLNHKKDDYYYLVHLQMNGKQKGCLLHRLVLSSFTDNIDGSLQVNHRDENKDNNQLTNFEWMTAKENLNYGTRNERAGKSVSKGRRGVFNTKLSKPVLQYDKNGTFIREWPSMAEVERQLMITHSSECCKGKLKSAGGFVWRYAQHLLCAASVMRSICYAQHLLCAASVIVRYLTV